VSGEEGASPFLRDLFGRYSWLAALVGSRTGQSFGHWLSLLGLMVLSARLGHASALGPASVTFAAALPPVFLGPWVAPLVERWDKRRTLVVAQTVRAVVLAAVVARPGVATLAVAALGVAAVHTFYLPAYRVVLAEMVPHAPHQLRVTAFLRGTETAAQLTGSAGGTLLAAFLPPPVLLFTSAALFLASAAFSARLPALAMPPGGAKKGGYARELAEGFSAVRASRVGLSILLLNGGFSVAAYLANPLVVVVPTRLLGGPLWWYSVFEVASGLAAMGLSAILAAGEGRSPRTLMALGLGTVGPALWAMAASHSLWLDVFLAAWQTAAGICLVTPAMALYRLEFLPHLRARASSVYSFTVGVGQLLGTVLAGELGTRLGIAPALFLSGALAAATFLAGLATGSLAAIPASSGAPVTTPSVPGSPAPNPPGSTQR
jgi:MFS family permease